MLLPLLTLFELLLLLLLLLIWLLTMLLLPPLPLLPLLLLVLLLPVDSKLLLLLLDCDSGVGQDCTLLTDAGREEDPVVSCGPAGGRMLPVLALDAPFPLPLPPPSGASLSSVSESESLMLLLLVLLLLSFFTVTGATVVALVADATSSAASL